MIRTESELCVINGTVYFFNSWFASGHGVSILFQDIRMNGLKKSLVLLAVFLETDILKNERISYLSR